jgi:hypothetical protein
MTDHDLSSLGSADTGTLKGSSPAAVPAEQREYITGLGRDYPHPKLAHLYEGPFSDPGLPMCARGWNRDDGTSYSIWRNNVGVNGICKICQRRADKGLAGVQPSTGRSK